MKRYRLKACERRLVEQARGEIFSYLDSGEAGPRYFNDYPLDPGTQEHADAVKALDGRDEWGCPVRSPWCADAMVHVHRDKDGDLIFDVTTWAELDREKFNASR